MTGLFHLA